ncbi:MAG: SDR family NAD(P)-dependent oxidoreductase [Pseudomonadota bacterium]|nr:SDR family NAD(P)-dependent oxidoreductase [Pseudomonadota bacterium]
MTKWTITGAAGFIGSNVAGTLIERGETVVGLDNLSSGRQSNIKRLKKLGGDFRFIEGDIRDASVVNDAISGADCIVHLAAQVSVQKSIENPVDTDAVNVGGFVSIVDAAIKADIPKVIYASSCAVYGENPKLPIDEHEHPTPLSPYAVSKYANDLYASVLSGPNERIGLVGLRFFNIFGPWQDATGGYAAVIPRWTSTLLDGGQATIFGDGGATRDFCHVDNVSLAIIQVGARTDPLRHSVYNIGTGVRTPLKELHQTLVNTIESTGRDVVYKTAQHLPWRAGDIIHSVASIERARSEIGFNPTVTLAHGIENLLLEEHGLPGSTGVNR